VYNVRRKRQANEGSKGPFEGSLSAEGSANNRSFAGEPATERGRLPALPQIGRVT